MNIQPDRIVFPTNRSSEMHLFGCVAVCWNIITRSTIYVVDKGKRITEETTHRQGKPYLMLVNIHNDGEDDYVDEDSPVAGGFSSPFGKGIAADILRAAEYLESQVENV